MNEHWRKKSLGFQQNITSFTRQQVLTLDMYHPLQRESQVLHSKMFQFHMQFHIPSCDSPVLTLKNEILGPALLKCGTNTL